MNSPTHNTTVPCATVLNNTIGVTAPSPSSPSPPKAKKIKTWKTLTQSKYLPSDVLEELMVFLGIAECCAIQATNIDFHKAIDFRLEKHCDPVVVSFFCCCQIVFLGVDRSFLHQPFSSLLFCRSPLTPSMCPKPSTFRCGCRTRKKERPRPPFKCCRARGRCTVRPIPVQMC